MIIEILEIIIKSSKSSLISASTVIKVAKEMLIKNKETEFQKHLVNI
jgi:hypothetical protein